MLALRWNVISEIGYINNFKKHRNMQSTKITKIQRTIIAIGVSTMNMYKGRSVSSEN